MKSDDELEIEALLAEKKEKDRHDIMEQAASAVFKRLDEGAALSSLPWPEQVVAIVYSAQGIIGNGSFEYFFSHEWPEEPPYATFVAAYRAIGAEEAADCIEVAASLFPLPDPHLDRDGRLAYLDEHYLEGSTMYALGNRVCDQGDRVFDLLREYVGNHKEEIRSSDI